MSNKREANLRFRRKQRKLFWMLLAGITAALVIGFGIVQLAIGTTFAGSNQKLDALNIVQLTREVGRNNPNKPAKHPPHGTLPSGVSNQPWPSGIIESGQAPLPGELYVINNQWQEVVGGVHLSVYAGSEAQDPSQGVLIVMTTSLDLQTSTGPHIYLTPLHSGALRIVGSNSQRLTLTSTNGTQFVFFVIPACAMSQPAKTSTECQLLSTS